MRSHPRGAANAFLTTRTTTRIWLVLHLDQVPGSSLECALKTVWYEPTFLAPDGITLQ